MHRFGGRDETNGRRRAIGAAPRLGAGLLVLAVGLGLGGCATAPNPVVQAATMSDDDWRAFVADWRRDFRRALDAGDVAACGMSRPVAVAYAATAPEIELRRYLLPSSVEEAIDLHGRSLLALAGSDPRAFVGFGGFVIDDQGPDRRILPLVTVVGGPRFLEAAETRLRVDGGWSFDAWMAGTGAGPAAGGAP